MSKKQILLVDDDPNLLKVLQKEFYAFPEFQIEIVTSGEEAWEKIKEKHYDLILLDGKLPKESGMSILKKIKKNKKTADTFEFDDLLLKIKQALVIQEETTGYFSSIDSEGDLPSADTIIGTAPETIQLKAKIDQIKNLDSTILIIGESGTGKGVVAKEIHRLGNRSNMPFVHLNCAALSENLIESELFGHEKGSFTGAANQKKGKFELARGGTIFLDEISTLSLSTQAKLLNVLQEKCIERVGGNQEIFIDARIIAATNSNLEESVAKKEFREDLYYRLNVITLECLPLRFTKQNIKPLCEHFLLQFNKKFNKSIQEISKDAWNILHSYSWPGNVRELENTIERAVALSNGKKIEVTDLPLRVVDKVKKHQDLSNGTFSLVAKEKEMIQSVLEKYGGHREKTARELGISKRTLQNKLNKYKLR